MDKKDNGKTISKFNDAQAEGNKRQDTRKLRPEEFAEDNFPHQMNITPDGKGELADRGTYEFSKEYENLQSSNNQEAERMQKTEGTGNPHYPDED